MDKASVFFRVFDVAFFAPGTLLFLALQYARWMPSDGQDASLSTARGALAILFAGIVIYVLGLICHGVQRVVSPLWERMFRPSQSADGRGASWYESQNASSPRQELAFYFWYLRATCWNVAIALALSILILAFPCEKPPAPGIVRLVGALAAIVVLIRLGHDFQSAMRRASA